MMKWSTIITVLLSVYSHNITAAAQEKKIGSTSTREPIVLQLRWYHQFQFAGYYAAVEQGFYREVGLDVTIKEYSPEKLNTVDEVLSDRADYGVTNSEILLHRLQEKPLIVLAAIFQHSPLVLVARQDSGIATPQDLIGRRVKMTTQTRDVELTAMLINEGISLDQLQLVDKHVDIEDYFDRSFDALSAYLTNEPYYLEQARISVSVIKPVTYGIDFYGDCLFTTEQELREHPERVKAFRQASLRGWQYAMRHPEELIEIILTKYGARKTRDHLEYEARKMRELILPELIEIGHINPGRWTHIAETFVQLKFIQPNYSLKWFLYDPDPAPDYRWLWWVSGIMLAVILLGSSGVIILLIFNHRLQQEIEDRILAEQALRENEQRYRSLFEGSLDGIVFVDTQGCFVDCNASYQRMLGYTKAELRDMNFYEITPAKWHQWEREEIWEKQLLQRGYTDTYEKEYIRKDGTIFPVELTSYKLEAEFGRPTLLWGVARDITDRKHTEEALRTLNVELEQRVKQRTAELEIVNRELKEFAYVASHDLKAPLRGIHRLARWLVEDYSNIIDDKGKEMVDLLVGRVQRMDNLIEGILHYSRIGRIQEEYKAINLNVLLQDVLDLLGPPEHIQITLDPDFPTIVAERTRIFQVFQNLIGNAMKFLDKPYGEVIVQWVDNETHWTFRVSDNGPGIEQQYQERIFHIFQTLQPRDEFESTGIGLALVKKIVNSYGGKIGVESEIGKGATFWFTFPKN